ncbi:MAG TPA: endonuclease/exonuclease/phosphatase family protein [Gemmatimonadaceae bacterium]|nr:endonuclease/exonuclease/phosphatase family protein [Gemmatimonadaceae bacterium]
MITLGRTVALAILLFSGIGCASQTRSGAALEPADTVRVLVYNIHAGKDAKGVDNLQGVIALIRETDADLVLLQEVDQGTRRSGVVDQPAILAVGSGFHVAFGSALDYDGGKYGVATLSRWPITFDTLYRLPVDPPQQRAGGSREPRGLLRADVMSPYGAIAVFNTHIDASREDTWRQQEARVIVATVTSVRQSRPLVVLGGDMNSTPESAVQQIVREPGLRDAFAECGRGAGLTYPADSAVKRIDYLYLSGAMRCARAEVPVTMVSDHRPLAVDVLIPRVEEQRQR